ncbi:carbohydrate ABC transporter permease [Occultella aeris]|uniref:L-arabinose transport system permease protein AraQ n=1 Tax=Occultella aeris TaxID=2761496 RepID=A0A7M4DGF5_9MICO|nr:carbohydrate ABC transporter permease [Occultella aeris]VZO35998.1 L-arabinose transport system permease protein AraQ [Occultella aeris]
MRTNTLEVRPRREDRIAADRSRLARSLAWTILLLVSLTMLAPFIWMVLTALKTEGEILRGDGLLPTEWRWQNFADALDAAPFGIYARNSLILAAAHTLMTVTFAAATGYSLAKLRFRAAPWIFGGLLAAMMIPGYATIVPQFLMVRFMPLFGGNNVLGQGGIGWIDSWWGLIIPGGVTAFSIFLFRQFFTSVPTELLEAARIDGVGEVGIFVRIASPQVLPAFLTAGLLSAENAWNNFLWPLLVTRSEEMRVIQVGLASFRQETTAQWTLMMAGTTLAMLPMIVLFLLAQRYFVQGFAQVGIK